MEPILKIEHLKKSFGNITPFRDVNCEIHKGDVIAIIGPSGCGKSTFINCLNRMTEPTDGRIWFDGEEITPKSDMSKLRMKMGMVFQAFHLFAHLTIIENIMLAPMSLKKVSREDAYNRAMELLKTVGLDSKADRYPSELSGGQQQRVAICRSLAMDPEVLLMDEPTSALDPTTVSEVENVVKRLAQTGLTMMIVTHEMKFAKTVSNRVFYMDEGGIYEDGPPEQIFDNPQKEKTRWFVQRMKVFTAKINPVDFEWYPFQVKLGQFAHSKMMSPKMSYRVQSVFEEYVFNVLLQLVQEGDMEVNLAYNEDTDSSDMSISFIGDELDEGGLKKMDDIARSIFEGIIVKDSFEYSHIEKLNRISFKIGGRE